MVGKQAHKGGSSISIRVTAALGFGLGAAGLVVAAYGLSQRRQARRALSADEWANFVGEDGTIQNYAALLEAIASKGLEHSLKSELWPLLLGVKKPGSTGEQLLAEYTQLKQQYLECIACCKALAESLEDSVYQQAAQQQQQQHLPGGGTPAAPAALPHELAQFSEVQRIIIMDAIRTDFERHAAAAAPSPPSSSSGGPQADAFPHLCGSLSEQRFQALLADEAQWQAQQTVWLGRAAREVLNSSPHLGPTNKYQAARLVTLLLAYAVHDPDTGYCQGMSDLAVPVLLLVEDDVKAFASFCRLMTMARGNFAVDEAGISAQLQALAALLQAVDAPLHHRLRQLGASHMHFAYRMLVVLLRRDLPMQQLLLLWEMMWAEDQLSGGPLSRPLASLAPHPAMLAAAALAASADASTAAAAAAASPRQQPAARPELGGDAEPRGEQEAADGEGGQRQAAAPEEAAAAGAVPGQEAAAPAEQAGAAEAGAPEAGAAASAAAPEAAEAAEAEAIASGAAGAAGSDAAGAAGSGPPSLLLCFVAAAVIAQRRKVLDDCRDCDDVLRLYNTSRIDFSSCLRKALDIRGSLQQQQQQQQQQQAEPQA